MENYTCDVERKYTGLHATLCAFFIMSVEEIVDMLEIIPYKQRRLPGDNDVSSAAY